MRTLLGFGPKISDSVAAQPKDLLRHEYVLLSLFPMHLGMRQYWRDLDSLLKWTRSAPHQQWWQNVLKDSGGTGFWHETYFRRGSMEAVYDDIPQLFGLCSFCAGGSSPWTDVRGDSQGRQRPQRGPGRRRERTLRISKTPAD